MNSKTITQINNLRNEIRKLKSEKKPDLSRIDEKLIVLRKIKQQISTRQILSEKSDGNNKDIPKSVKIRGKSNVIVLTTNLDYLKFDEEKQLNFIEELINQVGIENKVKFLDIIKGSTIITLELESSEEAERLFILIKSGKLENLGVNNASLISFNQEPDEDENNIFDLEMFQSQLKNLYIKDDKELISSLKMIIRQDSSIYNMILNIEKKVIRIESKWNFGILNNENHELEMNKIGTSLISIIDSISRDDITNEHKIRWKATCGGIVPQ